MNVKVKTNSAFNYFGAKTRNINFYKGNFPSNIWCFLEPMCGSASISLNVGPYPIHIISDRDKRIYNFFHVLRDHSQELISMLELTPYNRNEYHEAMHDTGNPVEDARRFFIRCVQSFGGLSDNVRRVNSWRSGKQESRHGMAMEVSKWWRKIDKLELIVELLKSFQIDNGDVFYMIEKYDSLRTFTFLDPPYVHLTRTGKTDYKFEFTNDDHSRLLRQADSGLGKFMICGYDNELYNDLLPATKWTKILDKEKCTNIGNKKTREVIWINYQRSQANLFT